MTRLNLSPGAAKEYLTICRKLGLMTTAHHVDEQARVARLILRAAVLNARGHVPTGEVAAILRANACEIEGAE